MENTKFPYDPKWETVTFEAPTKKIINFNDVTEYQQRPVHDEYLDFLTDLQKVIISSMPVYSVEEDLGYKGDS